MKPLPSIYQARCARAQKSMRARRIDVLVISVSSDLFYLTGYRSLLSERLTVLVIPAVGRPAMVIPKFEAVRFEQEGHDVFYDIRPWTETENPYRHLRRLIRGDRVTIAVSEQMWSVFLLGLQEKLPRARYVSASRVLGPLRMIKDEDEIESLLEVGRRLDRVFVEVCKIRFAGRTEVEVGDDIFQVVKAMGLNPTRAGGVASGPNSASPHHESIERRIREGDGVWLELGQGGTHKGYRADKTRSVFVGRPSEAYRGAYAVVQDAQETAVQAVKPGIPCQAIDRAGRAVIERAGYGEYFTHRIGHGLGLDGHEPPYIVAGNRTMVQPGMVFSVEPGIYVPGEFGIRIEDIVIVTALGAKRIYGSTHECVEVA